MNNNKCFIWFGKGKIYDFCPDNVNSKLICVDYVKFRLQFNEKDTEP